MVDDLGIGLEVPERSFQQAAAQRQVLRPAHQAERVLAVAAGATDLLVIGLDRTGRAEVRHGAHVGAVDAHAEGVGGADHVDLAGGECRLRGRRAAPSSPA